MTELLRASLADQVAQRLLAIIRDQHLGPGDHLPPESALAERFGVSRPVVREAIGHLKSLGIVLTHSGKPAVIQHVDARLPGVFFTLSLSMTSAGVLDLLEVRRGLEVQSAVLAAERCCADEADAMRDVVARMKTHLDAGDVDAFVEQDVALHLLIATASRNSVLLHLIEAIRAPLRETIRVGLLSRATAAETQHIHRLHVRVVDAIAGHDATEAAAAMAEHFDRALIAIGQRHAAASGGVADPSEEIA